MFKVSTIANDAAIHINRYAKVLYIGNDSLFYRISEFVGYENTVIDVNTLKMMKYISIPLFD